jgi:hypothetical protein
MFTAPSSDAGTVESVPLFETLRPAPPVPPPGGSLAAWIWVVVALAIVVAAGVVVASRH